MYVTCPECATRYLLPDNALDTGSRTVRCTNCGFRWRQSLIGSEEPLDAKSSASPQSPVSATLPDARGSRPIPRAAAEKMAAMSAAASFKLHALFGGARFPSISPAALRSLSVTARTPHDIPSADLRTITRMRRFTRIFRITSIISAMLMGVLVPLGNRNTILANHPEWAVALEPLGIYDTSDVVLADVNVTKTILHGGAISAKIECSVMNESKGSRLAPDVWATLTNADGVVLATSPNLMETGKNMKSGSLSSCNSYTFDANKDAEHVQIDMAAPFDYIVRR